MQLCIALTRVHLLPASILLIIVELFHGISNQSDVHAGRIESFAVLLFFYGKCPRPLIQ